MTISCVGMNKTVIIMRYHQNQSFTSSNLRYMLFKQRSCCHKRKLPQERNFGKFRALTFGCMGSVLNEFFSEINIRKRMRVFCKEDWKTIKVYNSFKKPFNTPCLLKDDTYLKTTLQVLAAGLFKHVWPFCRHQALKG